MLKAMAQVDLAKVRNPSARLDLVIVGGGATGVELAVELTEASHVVSAYGLPNFRAERDLAITLVEGAPRILSALPEKISEAATTRLKELGIGVETSCRVSEVTARFILDAMPGKQMAIDADLNAGLLTREEAKARREEVREEADFYGAMDGASKFIRGDAIAGILILAMPCWITGTRNCRAPARAT
ncbi:hypothetical protein G6F61_013921 [Rhizopus arrhizus]|nr:hypothetical protein G6F61_013921 [Rhizopus arrhizus]